jgi:hypothetical protein
MNYHITFNNASGDAINVAVVSGGTENFTIQPGGTDNQTLMLEGQSFTFFWRTDNSPCRVCEDPGCNPNTLVMPSANLPITLPDPKGRWLVQTN